MRVSKTRHSTFFKLKNRQINSVTALMCHERIKRGLADGLAGHWVGLAKCRRRPRRPTIVRVISTSILRSSSASSSPNSQFSEIGEMVNGELAHLRIAECDWRLPKARNVRIPNPANIFGTCRTAHGTPGPGLRHCRRQKCALPTD